MMVVCIRIHRLINVKKELILDWIQYKSFFEQSKLNILETCFTSLKIHINTKKTPFGLIDYKKTRLIDYPQKIILKANKKLSIQSSFFIKAKILVIQNNFLDFDQSHVKHEICKYVRSSNSIIKLCFTYYLIVTILELSIIYAMMGP